VQNGGLSAFRTMSRPRGIGMTISVSARMNIRACLVPGDARLCCTRYVLGFAGCGGRAQCLGMMNFTELPSVPSFHLVPFTDQLRLAVAGYLARFKGASRYYTESDLRCYLAWCAERGLDPLGARRPHLELYIRWM
jgi:hypothetical protein